LKIEISPLFVGFNGNLRGIIDAESTSHTTSTHKSLKRVKMAGITKIQFFHLFSLKTTGEDEKSWSRRAVPSDLCGVFAFGGNSNGAVNNQKENSLRLKWEES
jgi:hypothetical protein